MAYQSTVREEFVLVFKSLGGYQHAHNLTGMNGPDPGYGLEQFYLWIFPGLFFHLLHILDSLSFQGRYALVNMLSHKLFGTLIQLLQKTLIAVHQRTRLV